MPSNLGVAPGGGTAVSTAEIELAAFDLLPPDVKFLVDQAPIKILPSSALAAVRAQGVGQGTLSILALIRKHAPNWQPIQPHIRRRRLPVPEADAYVVPGRGRRAGRSAR
jgi:hypothetical protein